MMAVRRGRVRWLVLMASLAIAAPLFATTSGVASGTPADPHATLESQISPTDNSLTQGEPEIAQNPKNLDNLFIDWNSFRYPPSNFTPVPIRAAAWYRSTAG